MWKEEELQEVRTKGETWKRSYEPACTRTKTPVPREGKVYTAPVVSVRLSVVSGLNRLATDH
jgi:hypothetical protein